MRKIYRSQSQQALNPKELYNTFVKKYTHFKPYTQQDAQEFMRFLLEGLKSEVPTPPVQDSIVRPNMKRTRRRTLVISGTEDNESHDKSANNDTQRTYIDQLFGGKLASYVVCDVCKSVCHCICGPNNRYRQAMRIFKTSHYQFMMLIHPTCANVIDFEPSSSGQILLMYSTNKSTHNQPPQLTPVTKKTPEELLPMSEATCPQAEMPNPVTTLNVAVSTKATVKRLL